MSAPILHVAPGGTDGQGGIGRHLRAVHRAWDRLALDPPLVVLDSYGTGTRPSLMRFAGCAARLLGRARLGRARLGRAPGGRACLVHLHMAADGSVVRKLALASLARAAGLKVVVHLHGSRFADQVGALRPRARARLARALGACDAAIVLGEGTRALLVEALGLDPARILVLPNAVALKPRPAPSITHQGPCRIAFLGRLGARKGVPELLEALAMLDRTALDWHATLAGDGEVDATRDRVAALGLSARVTVTGWLDETDADALLARSDLLVLPSRREGQPMAILEAMSAGLPVVATGVGVVAELVHDNFNGLLVPPGDAAALSGALARLVADPALRRRLGDAAHATVASRHELDAFCRRLRALYETLSADRVPVPLARAAFAPRPGARQAAGSAPG